MSVCRNPCCQPANSTELSIYCKLLEICRRPTFWLQKVTVYMNEVLAHKGLHTLLTCGLKISAKEKKKKGNGMGGEGGAEDGLGNCPLECRISFTIKAN